MDLTKTASEMIEAAHTQGYGPFVDTNKYKRDIELEGYALRIIFTIDDFRSMGGNVGLLNHLTIGTMCGLNVPNRIVEEIASHFFLGNFYEIPSSGLHKKEYVRHLTDNGMVGRAVGKPWQKADK